MAPMEILVFVAVLSIVAALAMRFGHDSRQTVYSKEEELAGNGMIREQADATPPIIWSDAGLPTPDPNTTADREHLRVVASDSATRSA